MRIISGEKKGHSFYSYKSKDVRPLSDKNRETIFNIILHGKDFLQVCSINFRLYNLSFKFHLCGVFDVPFL